jgi:hypothetical protein
VNQHKSSNFPLFDCFCPFEKKYQALVQKIPRLVEKIPDFGRKSTTPGTKNTKLWYEYQNAKNFILAQQKVQTQPQS